MNEVKLFCANNPGMSDAFKEFAQQYSSMAEVWANCSRSDWMLSILSIVKYRNVETLKQYIDWLFGQVKTLNQQEADDLRRRYFNKYEGYTNELEQNMKAGKLTESQARWSNFFVVWDTACDATVYVLENRITDLELDNIFAKAVNAEQDMRLPMVEIDKAEIYRDGLREQADKLRELIGNPFRSINTADFYYGRDNFNRSY